MFVVAHLVGEASAPRLLGSQAIVAADSVYTSAALRDLVARASEENRQPPAALRSYRSRIESELSIIVRDSLGREHTAQTEQIATTAQWTRDGRYDLHVVGYRSQSIGVPYSALSVFRGWTVPSLYGNRLSFGVYLHTSITRGDTVVAVHPFAADRDHFYRYSGGDTVAVLRVGDRRIPIARVHVHANLTGPTRLTAFDGEIDLDADRAQIVRMRGQLVAVGEHPKLRDRLLLAAAGVVGVAYVEFVNAEVDGKYWLPAFQRTEIQATFGLFGQVRPMFRVVSNIDDIVLVDAAASAPDSAPPSRVLVTWAASDSVDRFGAWQRTLGTQTASVHSEDFDDLAPDVWRTTGPPRVNAFPANTAKLFRFNRVEGAYTGVAPWLDFRDLAPGVQAGTNVGWAWTERTMRGGAFVSYRDGLTTYRLIAERALVRMTTFLPPLSEDRGFGALVASFDPFSYLDRRTALASTTHLFGSVGTGLVTVQLGAGSDRSERARLKHGSFSQKPFPPNDSITDGGYALGVADIELHPNVTGEYVQPGVGLRAHYEVGSGQLDWQRAELGVAGRLYVGPISLVAHVDAGATAAGQLPLQRRFRLGGEGTLPGYTVDQFQGDYALLFRSFASYRLSVWKRPIHVWRSVFVPGVAPGFAVSAQGGWTAFSPAHRTAVTTSLETHGMRATAGGGLTLFSDAIHLGVARPLDGGAHWRFVGGVSATF